MDLDVKTVSAPSPKPLGQLGRDEMNLAEFPITLLTDRVPKEQTEAVYQDEIFDERTGRILARKLTIKAGGYGLTTAADDEVILALIQLTKQKNNFTQRRVEFSRLELIRMLDWPSHGASYDRIFLSLQRWTSVYLEYDNAWRDNKTKAWTSPEGFHIIDNFKIHDSRTSGEQLDLLQSHITWNEVIFESFQAGYLKPLDYDLCMGLRNSTAKRMYRFMDKRFHFKPDWTFDLKEIAHMHIGLGRNYEGPAHLKRNLHPAVIELENVGFLEPLPEGERFFKEGKDWKIRLIQKSAARLPLLDASEPRQENELDSLPLVKELIKRGVTAKTAAELVQEYPSDFITAKLEEFDWEMTQPKPPKKPAGYLVKSIRDGYATDPSFVSTAERKRREEIRHTSEQKATEERRQQREQEAAAKAKDKRDASYWESLTAEQQAELQAQIDAQADPAELAVQTGPLKSMGQTIRRREYIRQLLDSQEFKPTQG